MKTGNIWKLIAPDKGYTLIELLVVVALMTTITAIALPPYVQWRQGVQYRSTARALAAMLRDARSRAISDNRQYRVEFQTPTAAVTQYRMTRGTLSANSSDWSTVIQDWSQIINGVTVTLQNLNMVVPENCPANSNCIDFYPNGTVNLNNPPADIQVKDSTGALRFTAEVSNCGRIKVY